MKFFLSVFPYLLIGFIFFPGIVAGQNPIDNQQIIVNETVKMLQESSLVRNLDSIFALETDYPQKFHSILITPLISMDKKVKLESGADQKLTLEVHSNNSFIRLGRRTAERRIEGEFTLFLADQSNVISQTEQYPFSYIDTVSVAQKEIINTGNWNSARFHQEEDGKRRSFLSKVAEPVVIVGATAVTVFLLYNVRR
ncbi:MAG: hypothetical protein WD491_00195 [Balneolales bacterium]